MSRSVLAIISVLGKDQKGVVAQFATYVAQHGVNIEDIEQHVVRGFFLMDMLVDLKDLSCALSDLITGLDSLGKRIDMEVRVVLHGERRKKRVVLLASKEHHCAEKLLEDFRQGQIFGEVAGVLANHPDLEPLAQKHGVRFEWFGHDDPAGHFAWLLQRLKELKPDYIALARYMRILPAEVVRAFGSKIINIHPSLLPHFPGAAPYRQAFEAGVRVHGCTAHFVTEQLDEGPIILQDVFHIDVGKDSLEDVKRKGLKLEAETLARAVRLAVDEELVVVEGKVIFKPGVSRFLRPSD